MSGAWPRKDLIDMAPQPPIAATIAGSDTGGAAGVAADLKSFAAHGVHGVYALTMLTAQNTTGISAVRPLDADFIGAQLDALIADYEIAATKTGLLFSEHAVHEVVARGDDLGALTVDPVLVRSSGAALVSAEVIDAYRNALIPIATVITPNVAEASLLSGVAVDSVDSAFAAADTVRGLGARAIVVTGVPDGAQMADVFVSDDHRIALRHDLVETRNLLGTGCSFAASITARLACGDRLVDAVRHGANYVHEGLESAAAWKLGAGQGPIDHFARFR